MPKSRTNEEWLSELRSGNLVQEEAIADLRQILLRATLYTFHHRLSGISNKNQQEVLQFAEDCAQEALLAVLEHLADFRGDSKFTTWVYKFAVNTTLMASRREHWKNIPLESMSDGYFTDHHQAHDPDLSLLRGEVWDILREAIQSDLTEKQRQAVKLIVFDEVPMDIVVQHLGANRNAIYKLLHDARRKLKLRLLDSGLGVDEMMNLFSAKR